MESNASKEDNRAFRVFGPKNAEESRVWYRRVHEIGKFFWSHNSLRAQRFTSWIETLGENIDIIRIESSSHGWHFELYHNGEWRNLNMMLEQALKSPIKHD